MIAESSQSLQEAQEPVNRLYRLSSITASEHEIMKLLPDPSEIPLAGTGSYSKLDKDNFLLHGRTPIQRELLQVKLLFSREMK